MKKIAKLFSLLLILVLFAGCSNNNGSKTKPSTTDTSEKVSTKQGEGLTITIAGDDSADTSTLKNTIKVMNVTKNKEMKNGDSFDEGDRISVTLFNCASDVKLRIYTDSFDIFPWYSYEKLTGEDATTGQSPIEFTAEKNINVDYMVDDGGEEIEYCKYNITTTATNVTIDVSVAGMEEPEHKVADNDTIINGSSIYYTITNNSTTERVIFASYSDHQFDNSTIIEPGETLDDYDAIIGDIHFYVDKYVEYKAKAGTLPDGTSVSIKNEALEDIANVAKPKFEKTNITVTNSSTTNYIAKVMIDGKAIASKRVDKNSVAEFDTIILIGDITVDVSTIDGPTATVTCSSNGYIITGYLIDGEDNSFDSGDKIPTGLELSILVFNISNPTVDVTITITIGGEVAYTGLVPASEDGLLINGIYATGDVVITVE